MEQSEYGQFRLFSMANVGVVVTAIMLLCRAVATCQIHENPSPNEHTSKANMQPEFGGT